MFHNKLITLVLLLCAGSAVICAETAKLDETHTAVAAPVSAVDPVVVPLNDVEKRTTSTSTTSTSTTTTTTTTPAPTTTSTTTTPSTTTSTTTTTTIPPDTTTTTTTSTTTVAPPTTTPAPGPLPSPEVGKWNSSCIIVHMATQLNFTYETKDNKTASRLYNIPADAKVEDSHCGLNTTQSIQINWGPLDAQHTMLLQFDIVNKSSELKMIYFVLPLTSDNFPNAKENQTVQLLHRGDDFVTPVKMSYHCTRAQTFNLTEVMQDGNVTGTVTMSSVQLEAFMSDKRDTFSTAIDCDGPKTMDIVPIAVGIAMAALILIVLISYLCARRRSTSSGYMSF